RVTLYNKIKKYGFKREEHEVPGKTGLRTERALRSFRPYPRCCWFQSETSSGLWSTTWRRCCRASSARLAKSPPSPSISPVPTTPFAPSITPPKFSANYWICGPARHQDFRRLRRRSLHTHPHLRLRRSPARWPRGGDFGLPPAPGILWLTARL